MVELDGLENRCARKGTVGSNPTLSATMAYWLTQDKVMKDSIFTKIIKGEIPCYRVHEDNKTLAFLDIHPIQPGQTLVVPKTQVEYVWDLPDEDYHALMATAKQVAQHLKQVFPEKSRIAMHIEGLDVAHAHLKIFPFDNDAEFCHCPNMEVEADHQQLAAIASKLAF